VGHINNLIAAFWAAPCHGIRLSKKVLPRRVASSFASEFGRTSGIEEPHEFGYFWTRLLGYEELAQPEDSQSAAIDWNRVRVVLTNMVEAYGMPIVFKSFMLGWHIQEVQQVLPKTCFVRVRRDSVQNALSVLNTRRGYAADTDTWVGLKPREHAWLENESTWRQVAGQVVFTDAAVTREIQRAGGRNVLDVSYENMCTDPRGFLGQVRDLLNLHGARVELVGELPRSFQVSELPGNSPDEVEGVRAAVEEFAASVGRRP
jgi:hypothetical protein